MLSPVISIRECVRCGGHTAHGYRRFLPEYGFALDSIDENYGFFGLFGAHALYYVQAIRAADAKRVGLTIRIGLMALSLAMWPFAQILLLLGIWPDRLKIDSSATCSYHVLATRS